MTSLPFTNAPLLRDLLWQPTLCLLLGVAASLLWLRRPARAHRILLLAVAAALLTPLLSQVVRLQGWGLLRDSEAVPQGLASVPLDAPGDPRWEAEPEIRPEQPIQLVHLPPATAVPAPVEAEPALPLAATTAPLDSPPTAGGLDVSLIEILLGAWAVLTAFLVARLLAAAYLGWRLVVQSRPLTDASLLHALAPALAKLGEGGQLRIHASGKAQCPMIWSWGRRPVVLLPATARQASVDWVSILCHELAHWKRRDHLSGLLGEIAVITLPWHPLTWYARHLLGRLSEQACDDWVLASGQSPVLYAEALLSFLPQRRTHLALAAVSSRKSLVSRIRHILDPRRSDPVVGRRWALTAVLLTGSLVGGMALAQVRPSEAMKQPSADSSPGVGLLGSVAEEQQTVTGQVLGSEGKPLTAAPVAVLVRPKSIPGQEWPARWQELAAGRTDSTGHFQLQVPLGLRMRVFEAWAAAGQPGYGLGWKSLSLTRPQSPCVIQLHKEQPIHRRLVDLQGQPAAGIKVSVRRVWRGGAEAPDYNRLSEPRNRPPLWPQPVTTDAHGRFLLHGLDGEIAGTLEVRDDRFAPQELEFRSSAKSGEELTLALSPARWLEGRVTAADTGQPLAQASVVTWGFQGRSAVFAHAQTGADGRYRLGVAPGNYFALLVFAPVGGPYLSLQRFGQEWPKARQRLQRDFALPRGILVRGKVTDADSGRPMAGAVIQYYTEEPNNVQRFDLIPGSGGWGDHLGGVVTKPDGTYQIPVQAGRGTLLAVAPQAEYLAVDVPGRYLSPGRTDSVNQFVPLRLKPGEAAHEVNLQLRRTVTIRGRLEGPDGKPLVEARMFSHRVGAPSYNVHLLKSVESIQGGRFEVRESDPGSTYRLFFLDPRKQVGAFVEVTGKERTSGLTVKLLPCGSAMAQVVDHGGKPLAGLHLTLSLVVTPRSSFVETLLTGGGREGSALLAGDLDTLHYGQEIRTDSRGECVLPALIPGATYRLSSNVSDAQEFTVKPGEVRKRIAIALPNPG
jgi:beta-lactamase regulating signal transducer with metallopeptidase domain